MQRVKKRFRDPTFDKHGSIQSCIRTNDLELVGDGSHLTYFEMVGNFSFGNNDYESSVELWHRIIQELNIKIDEVRVHPSRDDHKQMWSSRGYFIVDDLSCEWSDGQIGGHCCELFVNGLEIGNLVNPLNHSTDVGFGFERLVQVFEQKQRVDETSIFDLTLHPIISDHKRTLEFFWKNGIKPGNKGREYVCRRLLRRIIRYSTGTEPLFVFNEWLQSEKQSLEKRLKLATRVWKRHKNEPSEWWWNTYGIFPEELKIIKLEHDQK